MQILRFLQLFLGTELLWFAFMNPESELFCIGCIYGKYLIGRVCLCGELRYVFDESSTSAKPVDPSYTFTDVPPDRGRFPNLENVE